MKKKNYMNIKALLIILPLAFVTFAAFAENYYRIYTKNDGLFQKAGNQVDSVKIDNTGTSITFYEGTESTFLLSEVDSITFSDAPVITKFDRIGWTADDGGIPHVGFMPYGPEALLDALTGTQWIPDIGQYPATAIIDMQSEKTVTSIYLYDRQELYTADFYLSTSPTFGSEVAVHMEFERQAHQVQTVQLAVPVKARYIKLVINPFTPNNYACPAEVEVYGFK
jgi:hypothetical protein